MTTNMAASLDSLPPEILEMITSDLRRNDLNALSRSCKYLHAISLPRLYHSVELRIPARCSPLEYFQNLLRGSWEGLKWTKQLYILAEPAPLPKLLLSAKEKVTPGSGPVSDATRAINSLIQELILKTSHNRLQIFHWHHSAPIDAKTLINLMSYQGGLHDMSIHDLDLKFPIHFRSIEGLEVLRFGDLSLGVSLYWACTIIANNVKTLRHLKLGAEGEIAWYEKHHTSYSSTYHWIAAKFGEVLAQKVGTSQENSHPVLSLDSLTLDGIEPHELESRTPRQLIDWANLSALTVNSSSNLKSTLKFLQFQIIKSNASRESTKLKSLDLRSDEKSCPGLVLHSCLTSFTGLVHLGLLLTDDHIRVVDLADILYFHGPTLRSLIWDIRSSKSCCPASRSRLDSFKCIQLICERCPHLVELGLTFNWKDFHTGEKGCLKKITQCLRKLTLLRTLHIRNLPLSPKMIEFRDTPLFGEKIDFYPTQLLDGEIAKAIAMRIMGKFCQDSRKQPPNLETIAVGSMVYRDIYPSHEYPPTVRFQMARSLWKLRIYAISYWQPMNFLDEHIPILRVVGEGTTTAAKHICRNIHILDRYWLG